MSDPQDRRMPPRFVPTLTEVVGEPEAAPTSVSAPISAPTATDLLRTQTALPARVLPTEPLSQVAAPRAAVAADLCMPDLVFSDATVKKPATASSSSTDAVGKLSESDLANVVTRLVLRSDFQDKLAQAVATVVAQQVHAQLSGQVATLTAKLPDLVERAVQNAITSALQKP